MIAKTNDRECEGILPTGREREAEATKISTRVALAIMYHLMFQLDTEPDDIAEFILLRFSEEHIKVVMIHSSYEI